MEYQLLTFGGLLINVWGPTWDWTAHIHLGNINLERFYCIHVIHNLSGAGNELNKF